MTTKCYHIFVGYMHCQKAGKCGYADRGGIFHKELFSLYYKMSLVAKWAWSFKGLAVKGRG